MGEPSIAMPMTDEETTVVIRTPDQRLRVFVSSTLRELGEERVAVRRAIERLELTPVLFELGARPHAASTLYRSYLAQSHIFVGIYWQRYGWVAPDMEISGLEDEYLRAGEMPKLIYIKSPAPEREERLKEMLDRIKGDNVSYKYFGSAEELRELVANDLALLLTERFEQATLRAVSEPPARPVRRPSLPALPAPLIGREEAAAEVQALLQRADVRLLTLTGPGGVGKSSLALEAVRQLDPAAAPFPDGIYWVSLAEISDAELVISAIARVLDVRERGGHALQESLADYLRERELLLLLDNFEQVLEAAPLLADLLAEAPGLTALVTSRAPLRLRAEHEYPVPPLPVPDASVLAAAALSENAAVQLYVARAKAVAPSFELTEENSAAVREIVRRLEGLPLAIELAAARSRLLSPPAILTRLDSRLQLLTGGARDLPARQQTMRDTVDWSYSLLPEEVQRLLARLSVFTGGFSLDAAEAVCNPRSDLQILQGIEALLDNSLLRREATVGEEPRFRMLEMIREYGQERLAESGDEQALRRQHAHFFAALAEEAGAGVYSGAGEAWLDRLEADHSNLRTALAWYHSRPDATAELWPFIMNLNWLWYRRGYLNEGRQQYEEAMKRPTPEGLGQLWAGLLVHAGVIAMWQSDLDAAVKLMEEGLPRLRRGDDPMLLGVALFTRGVLAVNQADLATAQLVLEETRALMEDVGQKWFLAMTLLHEANVALGQHDVAGARRRMEESLAVGAAVGDRWIIASAINNFGEIARFQGDYEQAARYYRESEELFQQLESTADVARASHSNGYVALAREETGAARALFSRGLALYRQLGLKRGVAECVAGLAAVSAAEGEGAVAAQLLSAVQARFAKLGAGPWPADRVEQERSLARARSQLGAALFTSASEHGRGLTIEQAMALAQAQGQGG